jgi:thiol:disulfide interchange protein/DsbC/DsbD-like thiol-disulfide interchange protein
MIHNRILLTVLAAAMLPASTLAQSSPRPPPLVPAASERPVEVELRSAARAVAPGDTIPVAIRLLPNPGWHTYWRHAGDVGSAPVVTWRLPDGFTAAPLRWPTPERIEAPPLTSYGYEREVHLLGAVHVPPSARVGSTAKLEATLTWVVCLEECFSGDVDVALTVPVAASTVADAAVARVLAAEAARIPARRDGWAFRAAADSAGVLLHVYPPDQAGIASVGTTPRVQFFIDSAGVIDHAAQPGVRTIPTGLELQIGRSAYAAGTPSRITGVLAIDTATSAGGAPHMVLEVDAPVVARAQLAAVAPPTAGAAGGWVALAVAGLLALLGGTLLNLMPCVLPVLSIKAFGIAEAAAHDGRTARRHVVLFGAGVLVSMWALVGVLLALRAAGTEVGWGYQLQNPAVVGALALLVFAAGLNMAGVFDLVPVGGGLSAAASRTPRSVEAFLGGVLVTALATPCSAPFLAAAVAYAVTAGAAASFVVFTALGLGLVWPLAMVAAVPCLRAWLPRPGAWMVTLRQVLAFPLFATVVWLAWVLGRQAGVNALVALLAACTLLAFGLWALGRFGTLAAPTGRRRLVQGLAIASVAAALALVWRAPAQGAAAQGVVQARSAASASGVEGALAWRPYSAELLEAQRDSGRVVLVDFTADWCLTCQVNERVAFGSGAVRAAIRDHGVTLLKADWTTRDPAVTRALAAFGRNSVPFVVIYPRARDAAPIILPTLLTSGIVTGAFQRAAASSSPVQTSAALTSGRIAPSPSFEATP